MREKRVNGGWMAYTCSLLQVCSHQTHRPLIAIASTPNSARASEREKRGREGEVAHLPSPHRSMLRHKKHSADRKQQPRLHCRALSLALFHWFSSAMKKESE